MRQDPIEENVRYRELSPLVDQMTDQKLQERDLRPNDPNYLTTYWEIRKKIFKEKFDLDWHTPQELNPESIFD